MEALFKHLSFLAALIPNQPTQPATETEQSSHVLPRRNPTQLEKKSQNAQK
jgi:hypothetical protein